MTTHAYKVRDARTEKRFFVDNVIIRGYGKVLGVYGVAVYSALCMHANLETQQGYPSHGKIADLLDCSIGKVKDSIRLLEKLNLILSRPRYDKETHRQTSNLYTLLTPPMPPVTTDTPPRNAEVPTNNPPLDQSYLKEEPALPDSPSALRFDELPIPRESGANDSITEDIAETEAMFKAPPPSSQEPPEQRLARLRDQYNVTPRENVAVPLEMVPAVQKARAAAVHPDMTVATKDGDPWAGGPLQAFCAMIHATPKHIKPSEKKNWPRALAAWSAGWKDAAPTPAEAAQCMEGFLQSELDWMTFRSPYEDGFKATLDLMLNRLRGGLPWNAKGKRNGGSAGGQAAAPDLELKAAFSRLFDENGMRIEQ